MGTFGLVLGVMGLFAGVAALVVSAEVSKRCHAMVREHAEAMAVLLNHKLSEQEDAFQKRLDEFRGRVTEAERASAMQRNQTLEAVNRVQARINAQDSLVGETLAEIRRKVADLELNVAKQARWIETSRRAQRSPGSGTPAPDRTPQPAETPEPTVAGTI